MYCSCAAAPAADLNPVIVSFYVKVIIPIAGTLHLLFLEMCGYALSSDWGRVASSEPLVHALQRNWLASALANCVATGKSLLPHRARIPKAE